jgi:hypothetical protein
MGKDQRERRRGPHLIEYDSMKRLLKSITLLCAASLLLLESATADQSVDANGNYYNSFTVCDASAVVVTDVSLLCDSPGTYYYGSGKYRNSASCKAGDKAKLDVGFQIQQDIDASAVTPYFTLYVSGYGSVTGQSLYSNVALCDVGDLTAADGQSCPAQGYYKVQMQFHWGDQSDAYEYAFNPKVMVGFTSNPQKGVYDLGGANTNKCSGDVFTNWTKGVRKSAANTIKSFFATFGILFGSIVAVFVAGWCVMRQSKNQPKEVVVEDPLDESNEHNKMVLLGNSQNILVDF